MNGNNKTQNCMAQPYDRAAERINKTGEERTNDL